MQDAITLNEDKHIYQKGCTRDCGYHEYFATSDGSVKAKPDESGYVFTVAEFTLDDATKYDNMARFEVEHFTYNRTFSHDGWQALYVPFDFNCGQVNMEDYDITMNNNFHEYELPEGPKVELEVKRVINGGIIPALTPCLIRKKSVGEFDDAQTSKFDFRNVAFASAFEMAFNCSSFTRNYDFRGTLDRKSQFLGQGNEYSHFIMKEGELWRVESSKQALDPQRWYVIAEEKPNAFPIQAAKLNRIAIRVIGDGDTTGIEDIYVTTDDGTANGKKYVK